MSIQVPIPLLVGTLGGLVGSLFAWRNDKRKLEELTKLSEKEKKQQQEDQQSRSDDNSRRNNVTQDLAMTTTSKEKTRTATTTAKSKAIPSSALSTSTSTSSSNPTVTTNNEVLDLLEKYLKRVPDNSYLTENLIVQINVLESKSSFIVDFGMRACHLYDVNTSTHDKNAPTLDPNVLCVVRSIDDLSLLLYRPRIVTFKISRHIQGRRSECDLEITDGNRRMVIFGKNTSKFTKLYNLGVVPTSRL